MVYSADKLARKEDPDLRIKMIDFSHAIPFTDADRRKDKNFGAALEKLIEVFQNLSPLHDDPELWKKFIFQNHHATPLIDADKRKDENFGAASK